MFSSEVTTLAQALISTLTRQNKSIVTAESCTGGLIAGALTAISGSSEVVFGGFVTYANAAKTRMIAVPEDVLTAHGAVSAETARAMASGALAKADADVAIAVTGIAGPTGGTPQKPVGLVFVGCATPEEVRHVELRLGDLGRDGIREATVVAALKIVLEVVGAD